MITSVKKHKNAHAAHRVLTGRDRGNRAEAHAHLDPDTREHVAAGPAPLADGPRPERREEFVPKGDRTVQHMLALREDIFTDFDEAAFRACLANKAGIVRDESVSQHGQRLLWYDRR